MKNFTRALRLVFRYPAALIGAVVCSLFVAVLWGGNISAVYPIMEITFQGRSMQDWVDDEISQSQKNASQLQDSIDTLRREAAESGGSPQLDALQRLETRRDAELSSLQRYQKLQPFIHQYFPRDAFQAVALIVLLLIAATVARNVVAVINGMLTMRIAQRIVAELRQQIYDHALCLDLKSNNERRSAALATICDRGVMAIGNGVRSVIGGAVREPLKIVACMIGAALISWRLLLFTCLLAPVATFVTRLLAVKLRREFSRELEEGIQMNQHVLQTLDGLQTVQANNMEEHERYRFRAVSLARMRKALRIAFIRSLAKPVGEIMGIAAMSVAILVGAYLVLNQETHLWGIKLCDRPIGLPALLIFYGLLLGICDPARKLSEVYNGIQLGCAAADRVFGMLQRQPRVVQKEDAARLDAPHRSLSFQNVSFHYHKDQPVLQDINLQIGFGETIAIIGRNGCGKSTLAQLVPRFYDPAAGCVRIDDVDLRDVNLEQWRRRIAVVTQQTVLFDDTVMFNIRYGSTHASEAEAKEAAAKAHAHDFIEHDLEAGYETNVGPNGRLLSGGQRQRIALARAILRDPEILILDEATSEVDAKSEADIQRALANFIGRRTTILIAHRRATLNLADRIVVMDAGRIVDVGTAKELSLRDGFYRWLGEQDLQDAA